MNELFLFAIFVMYIGGIYMMFMTHCNWSNLNKLSISEIVMIVLWPVVMCLIMANDMFVSALEFGKKIKNNKNGRQGS